MDLIYLSIATNFQRALRFTLVFSVLIVGLQSPLAYSQSFDFGALKRSVDQAASKDRAINKKRESEFRSKQKAEQNKLNNMVAERKRQEAMSTRLENNFNENEVLIVNLQEDLKRELGDLKELFGVIQQTASEAQEEYKTSIISAQYPTRSDELQQMVAKMAELTQLVSIDEIENLWFHLQNEMTEQGKILRYDTNVLVPSPDPEDANKIIFNEEQRTITRIGVFNALAGDDIARYEHERGFVLFDRQMDAQYVKASNALQNASAGVTSFQLDPTKGALLSALVRKPSLGEKVHEGKIIGYVILGLGAFGVAIALIRLAMLQMTAGAVKKQAQDKSASTANPLGRVMAAFDENPSLPVESMELVALEAIQKESPKLNRGVMIIKIIAVVAPLLGLLGTVTGMIQTFQAITLFGAGDPQMMAGGISQALVTTVLGLVVAIPTVFLHWLASSRAQGIEDQLETYSAGMLADRGA